MKCRIEATFEVPTLTEADKESWNSTIEDAIKRWYVLRYAVDAPEIEEISVEEV